MSGLEDCLSEGEPGKNHSWVGWYDEGDVVGEAEAHLRHKQLDESKKYEIIIRNKETGEEVEILMAFLVARYLTSELDSPKWVGWARGEDPTGQEVVDFLKQVDAYLSHVCDMFDRAWSQYEAPEE